MRSRLGVGFREVKCQPLRGQRPIQRLCKLTAPPWRQVGNDAPVALCGVLASELVEKRICGSAGRLLQCKVQEPAPSWGIAAQPHEPQLRADSIGHVGQLAVRLDGVLRLLCR